MKKILIRVNIPINFTDIQTEDVTYKDVSRQGRNYKEVDKTSTYTKEDLSYGNDRTAQYDSNER